MNTIEFFSQLDKGFGLPESKDTVVEPIIWQATDYVTLYIYFSLANLANYTSKYIKYKYLIFINFSMSR